MNRSHTSALIAVALTLGCGGVAVASLALLSLAAPAYAQALCEPQQAADQEYLNARQAEARVAKRQITNTTEMLKFLQSGKWKGGASMESQMTAKEAGTFATFQAGMAAGTMALLIESKRARDVRVIGELARLADKTARYGLEVPDEKSENYKLMGFLLAAREAMKVKLEEVESAEVAPKGCTLDKALILAAKDALKLAQSVPNFNEVNAAAEVMGKKYGIPLKTEKMSAEDGRKFSDEIRPVLEKVLSYVTLAADLQRMYRLNRLSQFALESRRQDSYISPGDIKYSGTTWREWVSEGRITRLQNEDSSLLNLINEWIPADIVKDWEGGSTSPKK